VPAIQGSDPAEASDRQVDRVFEIDEVPGHGTVVKCMGRTFSATAADDEVTITDITDITRPVRLGTARERDTDGRWRIVGSNGRDILTTASLLRAAIALRQAVGPAFTA
jgi:hypothetical protein